MLPVKTSDQIRTSKCIKSFRAIRHSTHSRRLLGDFGRVQFEEAKRIDRLSGMDILTLPASHLPGGKLESKVFGGWVDTAARSVFQSLNSGGILTSMIGGMLGNYYRRARGAILQFLIALFYKVLIKVLEGIYYLAGRIIIVLCLILFLLVLPVLLFLLLFSH